MEYAASTGRLEIVKWLQEQRDTGDKETLHDDTRVQNIAEVEVYIVQPVETLETSLQVANWVAVFPKRKIFREVFASRAGLLADVYDQRDPLLPWDEAHALRTLLERRRYRALDTAAAQGDLVMVKRLHEDGRWPCSSVAMDTAAGNGHLEVVKFLHDNRREGGTAIAMCSAAGNGHLEVVEWLHKNRGSDGYRSLVLDLAATNGHVDVLRWLVPRFPRLSCSPAFLPSVAAHGHIETLRYLHEEMHMALDLRVLESAIGSGHLPLVNYVADRLPAEVKNTLSPSVAEKAAASGNLELLAFVVERLGLWSPNMLGSAATTGNVELAEWIVIRSDSPLTESKTPARGKRDRAATSNSIDALATPSYIFLEFQPIRTEERFRLHGVEYALHVACAMGHLDVVTWICGNCEIFLNVPAAELHAKLGRLSIWKDALVAAARNGQVKILAWLHEKFTFFQKVPDSPRKMTLVGAMADAAAGHGQCCVLCWLQATVGPQMECPTDEHTKSAKAEDQPPMAQTSFVSTPGLLEAMVNRHIDVVQWICAADIDLVGRQTPERRGELATFLREEADGFVPSKLGFVFPPL
ncbi:hypothetical protein BBJ29_009938 [Phytophthora kernoviae]|uniref:Uncharacterized protein n=1 Tax=Phytophthora kernoviae TaxID=325452 RepID=A0A3F2RB27_9STRA|nr:hypothetical protein BBP00_00009977 [Phytophthora kernoviae]RLN53822.1 hypothetical protein BBJ29_009938 [Phytophthora kernoviae]